MRFAAVVRLVAALRAASLVTGLRAGAFPLTAGFAFAGALLAFTVADFLTAGFAFAGALTAADFVTAGFVFAGALLAFRVADFVTAGFAFAGALLAFTVADFVVASFAFVAGFRAGDLVAGMFGSSMVEFFADPHTRSTQGVPVLRALRFDAASDQPTGQECAIRRGHCGRPST